MKTVLAVTLLLASSLLLAQDKPKQSSGSTKMSDSTNAYPAQDNTPGSRMGQGSMSSSTIEGCVAGGNGRYALTDVNSGTVYLLNGSEELLKGNVGRQVRMTGVATWIQPSDQKGKPGYINPSSPANNGASGTHMGAKTQNFQVQDVQKIADQCRRGAISREAAQAASNAVLGSVGEGETGMEPQVGYSPGGGNTLEGCLAGNKGNFTLVQKDLRRTYRIEGDETQLQQDVGKRVQVSGHLQPGEAPVFKADTVQALPAPCGYQDQGKQAVGGKEGNDETAVPVTGTGSTGQTTPGFQTEAGEAQNPWSRAPQPGKSTPYSAANQDRAQTQTAVEGAPPSPEQIGQDPASAERMSQAAHKGEIGGDEAANYGLNGNAPTYSPAQGRPAATQENNAPGSAKMNTEAQKGQGSGGGMQRAKELQSVTTLVGCLQGSKDGHEFTLKTQNGETVRLDATREKLKDHVGHTVEVAGREEKSGEGKVIAGKNAGKLFRAEGVTDLAPTCGGGR